MCFGVKAKIQADVQYPYNRPACCRRGEKVQTGVRHPCTAQVAVARWFGRKSQGVRLPGNTYLSRLGHFCLQSLRCCPPVTSRTLLLAVFEILPTCHVSDNFCSCSSSLERTRNWLVGTPKRVERETSKQETARSSRSADCTLPPTRCPSVGGGNGKWELGIWKIHYCSLLSSWGQPGRPSHRNRGCRTVGVTHRHMQCGRVSSSKHHALGPGSTSLDRYYYCTYCNPTSRRCRSCILPTQLVNHCTLRNETTDRTRGEGEGIKTDCACGCPRVDLGLDGHCILPTTSTRKRM
jgi:hypothetical protein